MHVYCDRCRPRQPIAEWLHGLKAGDEVCLQPYAVPRRLSSSKYKILERHGDWLSVQLVGHPGSTVRVHVNDCGRADLSLLPMRGAPS
jgi:hypothetical protein